MTGPGALVSRAAAMTLALTGAALPVGVEIGVGVRLWLDPRVDEDLVVVGVLASAERNLQLHRALRWDDQRCLQDQLLQVLGTDLLFRSQRQLDEGGPGQ